MITRRYLHNFFPNKTLNLSLPLIVIPSNYYGQMFVHSTINKNKFKKINRDTMKLYSIVKQLEEENILLKEKISELRYNIMNDVVDRVKDNIKNDIINDIKENIMHEIRDSSDDIDNLKSEIDDIQFELREIQNKDDN
jgi:predicted RNase H-like nuclease (RuvC/YqgF family)